MLYQIEVSDLYFQKYSSLDVFKNSVDGDRFHLVLPDRTTVATFKNINGSIQPIRFFDMSDPIFSTEERKQIVEKILSEMKVVDVHDKLIVFPYPPASDPVMTNEDFEDISRLLGEYAELNTDYRGAIGLCYLPKDFKTMTRQEIRDTIADLERMLED
jgi:hypothetical protein